MLLSDAIQHYLVDRKAKGKAVSTIRAERHTLSLLLADVGNIKTLSLRHQHLDLFWSRRTSWKEGTMNLARYHLNSFLKWCQTRGYVKDSTLVDNMTKVRVPERSRVIIPQSEFSTFLAGIPLPRARACVALGLYLFLRRSEIAGLRWQDIMWDERKIVTVRQKVGKVEWLPMCDELHAELRRWAAQYAAEIGRPLLPHDYVIPRMRAAKKIGVPGQKGKFEIVEAPIIVPGQPTDMHHIIKNELIRAGYYQPHEGGHTLRRSGAVALYHQLATNGHDKAMRIVQWMLGHKSIRTTEIYLKLDLEAKGASDLLSGRPMFAPKVDATVVDLSELHG